VSILQAQDTQFRLAESGSISYQEQATNPLPGIEIAVLEKGDNILAPKITFVEAEILSGLDKAELRTRVEAWFAAHLKTVLEPLVALEDDAALTGAAKGIAFQVHEAMGIVPREQLEGLIADLDTDMRRDLRGKKVRLGPILVFIPALNKPAAVRLRALLWGLDHGKALPMDVPKDGIVSFAVDEAAVDKGFYQSIGYPVFGGRAIRIDMLDRVISAVYDAAENGQFKAEHKMAEWLGSSIEGLYAVLEAMGHKKVSDPADEVKDEAAVEAPVETPAEEAPVVEDKADVDTEEVKPAADVKPELATFRLKKGKAFQKAAKPFVKKPYKKPDADKGKPKGKRNKETTRQPKVMSTGPEKKLEDSPFAILAQLQQKNGND
jgi:ATP-dependent RNA helicase SUPV3L1/SUV3